MLQKTKGIVLKNNKYSETSVIARIYTEKFGLQSYLINGVRTKKAKIKASLLQPMSLLEMVVYHRDNKNLQRVAEIKQAYIYKSLLFNITKGSLGIFLLEVIYRTIQEQEPNNKLFNFIFESFKQLDLKQDNINNFHLFFMLHLTRYLGFLPDGKYSADTPVLDLVEGIFKTDISMKRYLMDKNLSEITSKILQSNFDTWERIEINYAQRKRLLEDLIRFYNLHISNFNKLKSLAVLEKVLSN